MPTTHRQGRNGSINQGYNDCRYSWHRATVQPAQPDTQQMRATVGWGLEAPAAYNDFLFGRHIRAHPRPSGGTRGEWSPARLPGHARRPAHACKVESWCDARKCEPRRTSCKQQPQGRVLIRSALWVCGSTPPLSRLQRSLKETRQHRPLRLLAA